MCGEGGTVPYFPVKTLSVAAGSILGFGVAGQNHVTRPDLGGTHEEQTFTDVGSSSFSGRCMCELMLVM
jgi:hypothetical protein